MLVIVVAVLLLWLLAEAGHVLGRLVRGRIRLVFVGLSSYGLGQIIVRSFKFQPRITSSPRSFETSACDDGSVPRGPETRTRVRECKGVTVHPCEIFDE